MNAWPKVRLGELLRNRKELQPWSDHEKALERKELNHERPP